MDRKTAGRLLISIVGVMSLFGLTWLFGAFTVVGATLVFQVLFAIFNSLQGFFIFLFYCVFSRDARELWKETLSCGRYKSKPRYTSRKSGGTGTTPRNNPNTLSTGTGTGAFQYSSHKSEFKSADDSSHAYQEELKGSSIFEQSHSTAEATDQVTAFDTSGEVHTNPAMYTAMKEQDSSHESSPADEASDMPTSNAMGNLGDYRYSYGVTPILGRHEFESYEVDFH